MRQFVYGTTYCRSCGADVALNAAFCPNCGNQLPGQWDLNGLASAGLLLLLLVVGIIPLFPVVVAVAFVFFAIRLANKFFGNEESANQKKTIQCDCGALVEEANEGDFETTGAICPVCGTVLRG